jgi:hypothetical protein
MKRSKRLYLNKETLLSLSERDIASAVAGEEHTISTIVTVVVTISKYTPKITETISYALCDPTGTKGGTNERSVCQFCQA